MNSDRVRTLNNCKLNKGSCVMYWMSRDQRVQDNWALLYAQHLATEQQVPLIVVFALSQQFLGATLRQYDFMLTGLYEVQKTLQSLNIPFIFLHDNKKVPDIVTEFVDRIKPSAIVTDFSPLKIGRQWRLFVAQHIPIPMYEVDAHNIVPVWVTSTKQEFAAHTIRLKIFKLLAHFLESFPEVQKQENSNLENTPWTVENTLKELSLDKTVPPVDWITPGEKAASETMHAFIAQKLERYRDSKNDPTAQGVSNLSPYLHFGQISAQRIALEVQNSTGRGLQPKMVLIETGAEAYLEELIVRKELSDNYCYYNNNYDSLLGAPDWAIKSLHEHITDRREHLYTREELEQGKTGDDLWNASQMEMVTKGKMHGYMRMYWAKKILEWTESPEQAIDFAIYLNDKYELDGRDPNAYVGILWSIAGLHDRPWFERSIFGKVRYMSGKSLKTKFDTNKYTKKYLAKGYNEHI